MHTTRGMIERPDCRLYYEVTGHGPVVVFAHGLGGTHLSWWQQVAEFRDRYTCVTFAHRGFAPSTMPPDGPDPEDYAGDLAALIDHLKATDVRLIAQSMGGWTCLEYALIRPQSVRALVLAATAGTIERRADLFETPNKLAEWSRETSAAAADLYARGGHPAAGARMMREQPAMTFLYQSINALSAGLDREALRKKLHAGLRRPPETFHTFNIPTLFVTGDEDIVYPSFLSDALAKLMPNARVEQVRQAGHSAYFERAAAFNRVVGDFLAQN